jgi:hypothetical protein
MKLTVHRTGTVLQQEHREIFEKLALLTQHDRYVDDEEDEVDEVALPFED